MAPIIGITTYGRIERPAETSHYPEHYTVPAMYVNAVRRAGGVPMLLVPGEQRWERWLDVVDGVVVTGGTDVDPRQYGSERNEHILITDHERDESELALARELSNRGQPALFVCRGMQILNVALGGTLHRHIPDLGVGDMHRDEHGWWAYHDISAEPGSRIADAMGTTSTKPCSGHHQALDAIADPLTVTARAPDGIVEAVEHRHHHWMVGVQWHPEVNAYGEPAQQGIFDHLVKATAG